MITIEKEIMEIYKGGKYSPTGSDGGVMSYIRFVIDGKVIKASITNDSEIAKIRAVWCLNIDGKEIYNLSSAYYKLRP